MMRFFGAVQDPVNTLVRGLETLCKQLQTASNFRPDASKTLALAVVDSCTTQITRVLNAGPALSAPSSYQNEQPENDKENASSNSFKRSFY